MNRWLTPIAALLLCTMWSTLGHAKDVKDTLYSSSGDRVIPP